MSESPINLPAIRSSAVELMDRRTDSWTAVVEQVAVLATRISDTELVPKQLRGKPAAVAAVILYGREIGLPPMTALRTSYVVDGRVALAAETMRGLVLAAGHELIYREATTARCVAAGRRRGSETWSEVEWNLDIARAAGLLPADPRSGWTRYRRAMLKARATAELCRDVFPDVIGGFAAVEELDDEPPRGDAEPAAPPRKLRRAAPRPAEPEAQTPRPDSASPTGPGEVPLPGEEGYDELAENAPEPVQEPVQPVQQPVQRDTSSWRLTDRQRTKMHTVFGELEVNDRDLRLRLSSLIVGRDLTSSNDLTRGEAVALIDTLERIAASNVMREAMRQIVMADDPLAALDEVAAQAGFSTVIQPTDNPEPEEPPE